MLGIIRVLTTDQEAILQEHGKLINEKFQIPSVTKCIPNQPNGIHDDESEATALPKIVELARQMAYDENVDALTISCAADPALHEVNEIVDIPVFGAGVCGAHAASMVGNHVGVIGITEEAPVDIKQELGSRFFSYSFSPDLRKTTDLFSEEAKQELLQLSQNTIQAGAEVILFACTGFSTIRLKDYLVKHIDTPVIDLVEAQGIAYQLGLGE